MPRRPEAGQAALLPVLMLAVGAGVMWLLGEGTLAAVDRVRAQTAADALALVAGHDPAVLTAVASAHGLEPGDWTVQVDPPTVRVTVTRGIARAEARAIPGG